MVSSDCPEAVVTVKDFTIWNPPGVRTIANEIQKPPYEDSAVAPKVFPTAISLLRISKKVLNNTAIHAEHTTCPQATGRDHHIQKPKQQRCWAP